MKKITLLAMLIIMLICGCKSVKEGETLGVTLRSIKFKADILYYNENYSCDCTRDENGNFNAIITAPDNLNGLSVAFVGDTLKIKFNDIELSNADRFLPQNTSIKLFNDVLKACEKDNVKSEGRNLSVSGSVDGTKFLLKASPTGLPISLEIPDKGMSVTFKDVSVTSENNRTEEN